MLPETAECECGATVYEKDGTLFKDMKATIVHVCDMSYPTDYWTIMDKSRRHLALSKGANWDRAHSYALQNFQNVRDSQEKEGGLASRRLLCRELPYYRSLEVDS